MKEKQIKYFLIILLVSILIFGLIGCEDDNFSFTGKDKNGNNGGDDHKYLPVQFVTIDKTEYRHNSRFGNDDPLSLRVRIEPANATEKGIEWKSSNESIATVNDGKVTFKALTGVVTISAISLDTGEDDDPEYERKKAECIITIDDWDPVLKMLVTGTPLTSTTTEYPGFQNVNGRNNRLLVNANQPGAWYSIPWKDNPDGLPGETEADNGNNTFIYLDTPITQPMTITARIRIVERGVFTAAGSAWNGIYLGAITDPRLLSAREVQFSGVRLALNCENETGGGRRLYISRDDGTMAGTPMSTTVTPTTPYTTEYIYKIDRNPNGSYTGEVLNNVTGSRMTHNPNTGAALTGNTLRDGLTATRFEVSYDLRPGRPAYAGIIISGVMAEISQFKVQIWDGPPLPIEDDPNQYPTPGTVIYYSGDANPM